MQLNISCIPVYVHVHLPSLQEARPTHPLAHSSTHPLAHAVARAVADDLDLLPEDAVLAPAPDLGAGLDCKDQQDDEAHEDQEAQDDGDGLRRVRVELVEPADRRLVLHLPTSWGSTTQ